jgi:putative phosphoesterase
VIIGILSDTHDRLDAMAAGLALLKQKGATFFIHCGDIGAEPMIDLLVGEPAVFVWGNCDWDRRGLERYAYEVGVDCRGVMADLVLDDKRIAVVHGDDARAKHALLESQRFDYLLQGHTHLVSDERIGKTRVINPGALHRAKVKTVATLDLSTDELVIHPVTA